MSSSDSVSTPDARKFSVPSPEEYPKLVAQMIPGRETSLIFVKAILSKALNGVDAPHVLVVGAGGGEEIIQLAEGNPSWRFTGEDLSEPMIELGRQRVAAKGLGNEVTWFQGPIDQVEGTGFDAATCILTAHFIEDNGDRERFYAEIHRRLKPGAPLILHSGCYDPNSKPGASVVERMSEEDHFNFELHFQHARLAGAPEAVIEQQMGRMDVMPVVSEARERELLQAVGFSRIYKFFQAGMMRAWVATA
jgi:tRNA (cmo5U34)-methyltransferase